MRSDTVIIGTAVFFCSFVFLLNVGLAAANATGTLPFLQEAIIQFADRVRELQARG